MVLVGVFRLDEIATHQGRRRPRLPGNDENGHVLMSDPDGTPWNKSAGAPHTSA
jgi:hypothetical protein